MKKDTIFWDVDTQYDFLQPDGNLYVPGAETISDTISEVRKFALENGYSIIASTDWHKQENEEISQNADFKQTYPPHCMAGSKGSERLGFMGNDPIQYIETDEIEEQHLQKLIDLEPFHLVIRKEAVDVFSNPNTAKLINLIEPKSAIVFGIALDICVKHTINGLKQYPGLSVTLLEDVTRGLSPESERQTLDAFKKMSVEIVKFEELKRQMTRS